MSLQQYRLRVTKIGGFSLKMSSNATDRKRTMKRTRLMMADKRVMMDLIAHGSWLTFHFCGSAVRGKRRGRKRTTALNAPKGNPKQLFVEHPQLPPGQLACLICLQRTEDPAAFGFAMGNGTSNAQTHLEAVHGLYKMPVASGSGKGPRQSSLGAAFGLAMTPEAAKETLFAELINDLRPFTFLDTWSC